MGGKPSVVEAPRPDRGRVDPAAVPPSSSPAPTSSSPPSSNPNPVAQAAKPTPAAARGPKPAQPVAIGDDDLLPVPKREWDDDDEGGDGGLSSKAARMMLSKSAPVYSHRFPQPAPNRPTIKPVKPVLDDLPDLPDFELPPPSLPDSFRVGSALSPPVPAAGVAHSAPLSRSLLQYAMSCPPDLHPMMQNRGGGEDSGRGRKGSIIDFLAAGDLNPSKSASLKEENEDDEEEEDEGNKHEEESDDELPFR